VQECGESCAAPEKAVRAVQEVSRNAFRRGRRAKSLEGKKAKTKKRNEHPLSCVKRSCYKPEALYTESAFMHLKGFSQFFSTNRIRMKSLSSASSAELNSVELRNFCRIQPSSARVGLSSVEICRVRAEFG